MLTRLITDIQERRKRRSMARLRDHLAFFRYDTSNVPDDELEPLLLEVRAQFARAWNEIGVSAMGASAGLLRLSNAISKYTKSQHTASP